MTWKDYFAQPEYIMALPLADRAQGANRIIGTATFVLPGVFLTAKHMIEHYFVEHDHIDIASRDWTPKDLDGSFELDLLHIMKDKTFLVWRINKVHLIENADLAVLVASGYTGEISPAMQESPTSAKIDLHFPSVGSRVISLGYPDNKNLPIAGTTKSTHELSLRSTAGIVEDIDTGTANLFRSPRLQTNAAIDGGMSGGPVVNEAGVLFGINGSALTPTEEHNFYTSFVTPLWSAMGVKVKIALEENPHILTETTLLELAKNGYLEVVGLEHFAESDSGELEFNTRDIKCPDCP